MITLNIMLTRRTQVTVIRKGKRFNMDMEWAGRSPADIEKLRNIVEWLA